MSPTGYQIKIRVARSDAAKHPQTSGADALNSFAVELLLRVKNTVTRNESRVTTPARECTTFSMMKYTKEISPSAESTTQPAITRTLKAPTSFPVGTSLENASFESFFNVLSFGSFPAWYPASSLRDSRVWISLSSFL